MAVIGHAGTMDLFADQPPATDGQRVEPLADGAMVLRGFAMATAETLWREITRVIEAAPLRRLVTPGGLRMSVAMTNCGKLGWLSDRRGYRYDSVDPDSGHAWPPLPAAMQDLARKAAAAAGFPGFDPDACLVNRYEPGARLTLHQDRDEKDLRQPIVSLSLGLPAVFLFGGAKRSDSTVHVPLAHGDVVVWGGASRLRFHGVLAVKDGWHPMTGPCRVNVTFRRASG
jgi:alkylated DNA repair protein (DNA oxidative demethylase)